MSGKVIPLPKFSPEQVKAILTGGDTGESPLGEAQEYKEYKRNAVRSAMSLLFWTHTLDWCHLQCIETHAQFDRWLAIQAAYQAGYHAAGGNVALGCPSEPPPLELAETAAQAVAVFKGAVEGVRRFAETLGIGLADLAILSPGLGSCLESPFLKMDGPVDQSAADEALQTAIALCTQQPLGGVN